MQQSGQPLGPAQEASQSPDRVHRPPAGAAGAQLREAEVPERAGPHGAGGVSEPHRHAGQNVVPEPQVRGRAECVRLRLRHSTAWH